MLLVVAVTHAQALPWECVTVSEPADAWPYLDAVSDGSAESGASALTIAEAWVDASE